MRLGIIGMGTVGQALARSMIEHYEVRCYDRDSRKCIHTLSETIDCDLVFVCLPTPMREDKQGCDLTILYSFFQEFRGSYTNFVLKSTVPIGTTQKIHKEFNIYNIIHSPEFITARCALVDAQIPSRNIIGCTDGNWYSDCRFKLGVVYEERFPQTQCFTVSSGESEAIKLITNAFFATKVGFFNEMYQMCINMKLDWPTVISGVLADGRISPSHTNVPGPDGRLGFGGSCLPKDLNNLIQCMYEANAPSPILRNVQIRNNTIDRKES